LQQSDASYGTAAQRSTIKSLPNECDETAHEKARLSEKAGPGSEYTGVPNQLAEGGSDLAHSEWIQQFAQWLRAAGFTDDQLAVILKAVQWD